MASARIRLMERLSLERLKQGITIRANNSWWYWPIATPPLIARTLEEVQHLVAQVESHPSWSASVIAYEAAPAFDHAFVVRTDPSRSWLALAFMFNSEPEVYARLEPPPLTARVPAFEATIDLDAYGRMFEAVRSKLAAGDTYQVNATFPLSCEGLGLEGRTCLADEATFSLLNGDNPPPYAAYIPAPDGVILSLSPELFFEVDRGTVTARPMKGTRPRDADPREMERNRKDRAENLMIVDMIRNDLGRIAATGTVSVPKLFDVEDHGTVWQMTSTVTGQSRAPLTDIFKALFPCASVTGAPKIETTRIIAEIEAWPRGVYTGTIGIARPDFARFSVAIRTLEASKTEMRYGVGSGLVWDSSAESEWQECLAKAEILRPYGDELRLLETMRWEIGNGFPFFDYHMQRLAASAKVFGFDYELARIAAELDSSTWHDARRVRILLSKDGRPHVTSTPIRGAFVWDPPRKPSLKAAISQRRVDSQNSWLRHKTSLRRDYELAVPPGFDDAILVNERDEVTEFTIGNFVALINGRYFTPHERCGLLLGVYRAHLLKYELVEEAVITLEEVQRADAIYRINSVRGWQRARVLTIPS